MTISEKPPLTPGSAGLSPAKQALLQSMLEKWTRGEATSLNGGKSGGEALGGMGRPPLQRRPPSSPPPRASFSQERLWFLHQLDPDNPAYNLFVALRLSGPLNIAAVEQSINALIQRHEILRTTFATLNGELVQVITAPFALPIPVIDLSDLPAAEREATVLQQATEAARRPFDLTCAPLLRITLFHLDDEQHVLLLTLPHILSDGWSTGVFIRELVIHYEAFSQGRLPPLEELHLQYADYALWQRQWMQGEVLEKQLSYWRQQLASTPELLELPTDFPRPAIQSYRGRLERFCLSPALQQALRAFSQQEGVTLFMTLLAAFNVLLYRYTNQADLVVGTPIANRNQAETEALIGPFINTLALRSRVDGEQTFRSLLQQVKETALEAYAHQDLPYEQLVEALQPERNMSRTPLFQVMFVLQNAPLPSLQMAEVSVQSLGLESGTAKFDWILTHEETPEGLQGVVEYSTDLFTPETVRRWIGHWQVLLEGILANPEERLGHLPLLTPAERQVLIDEWGAIQLSYPPKYCLHELFDQQVERTPDAIALTFPSLDGSPEQHLTYRQLSERANQVANYLQGLGVGADDCVVLYLERTIEMVVAILGVLKSGGAYVPLDPTYPRERVAYVLDDLAQQQSGVPPVLLTQTSLRSNLPENAHTICVDTEWETMAAAGSQPPESRARPEHLAYVLYTSGSTGRPKGVLIEHDQVVRIYAATQHWFHFDEHDTWTLFHSYAFDLSVWEMWGAWLHGGRLIIIPYWVSRSPETFYQLLVKQGVTVLTQTPSAYRQLIRAEELVGVAPELALRLIILGGEALELQSVRPWFERHGDQRPRVINMYGITETTIHVTYRPITWADVEANAASVIGYPIPDLRIYLLDPWQQPVPIGVPGEIYVGGAGLGRGYFNRPELTAQRFIRNTLAGGPTPGRLYRSGDLARYLPNGDMEYLGRIDLQVKIHGFRIELGEIETALVKHPAIREALVLAVQAEEKSLSGDKRLVGYVVYNGEKPPSVSELRSFLKEKLPEYMVPAVFVFLEAFPLTPNGKLDRRALPSPGIERPALEESYVAPRTPTEEVLAQIWAQVLGVEKVGIHDQFFALGGDSIRSLRVLTLGRERGLHFSLQQLFKHPTIAALAAGVQGTESDLPTAPLEPFAQIHPADRARLPAGIEDAYGLTDLQMGMLFHSEYATQSTVYHNVTSFHLQAPFDLEAFRHAVQTVVERHPNLRTSFDLNSYSEPLQLVHTTATPEVTLQDWRSLPPDEQQAKIQAFMQAERQRHFDLTKPPLLRFHLHRRTDDSFQLTITDNHAILDGWSYTSTVAELFDHYFARLQSVPLPPAAPLGLHFRDYVFLERQMRQSPQSRTFWENKLADATLMQLPRRPQESSRSTTERLYRQTLVVPAEVTAGLQRLARQAAVPLKSVCLAAHARVMSRLSGQTDIVTGLVTNGRPERAEGTDLRGLFLNTVPYRLKLPGGTWQDLSQAAFQTEWELLPHRWYSLALLQQQWGRQPLFETLFNFVHFHTLEDLLHSGQWKVLEVQEIAETNFTLAATFSLSPADGTLRLLLDCDAQALEEDEIQAIGRYYLAALHAIATEPARRYETVDLLSEAERRQLLESWSQDAGNQVPDIGLHTLFESQVERTPEAVAVSLENADPAQCSRLTYSQLNRKANQLAHFLRGLGIGPDVLVGVCLERSPEMVIALLGVLKAGGAYIPLDPEYPRERLAYILDDSRAALVLTQSHLKERLPEGDTRPTLALDSAWSEIAREPEGNPATRLLPDHLAYVIYTSGSTGRPKGVQIRHRSVVNFLSSVEARPGLSPQDTLLSVTTIAFDIAGLEIYLPLSVGAKVALASREATGDGTRLMALLDSSRATLMQATPATWYLLLAAGWNGSPQFKILCGGEAISQELAQQLLPRCAELWNLYGPTETTIWSTVSRLTSQIPLTIGRPIANTQVYLLDPHLQLTPPGVPGELYLGGDGLARGYAGRADLTAERFVPHPFADPPGARLYRTGDLCRYLPNGELEYLGRLDGQVKLRGYRIELGEIEGALERHEQVARAVVALQGNSSDDKRLVGYILSKPGRTPESSELRAFLRNSLPEYMLPSAWAFLDHLPLTPNGKVNRRALPSVDYAEVASNQAYLPPQSELERMLATIWQEVLQVERVGIQDNFFALGGHSLLLVRARSRLNAVLQREISIAELFSYPTIQLLSEYLSSQNQPANNAPTTTEAHQTAQKLQAGRQRLEQQHQRRVSSNGLR